MLKQFLFIFSVVATLLYSCKASSLGGAKGIDRRLHQSKVFQHHFTGFSLYDPQKQSFIADHNGNKYFTPASNTKLFTFYAGLKILGDSVPAFKYLVKGDSLYFWGTGDPSFLHPDHPQQPAYDFLSQRTEQLVLYQGHFIGEHFGPGWSWDDFNEYYSAEKAPFPIYGNIVRFHLKKDQPPKVFPAYFSLLTRESKDPINYPIRRSLSDNLFMYQTRDVEADIVKDIPFKYATNLFIDLLADTLERDIQLANELPRGAPSTFYGLPVDSLYKVMLQDSDNFVAEQIMFLCSSQKFGLLSSGLTIEYIKKTYLRDLPDNPVWVDGSGLSRYNLFTPRTLVRLLEKIYAEIPEERLFALLPAGGMSIDNDPADVPYIYAKTGSLTNNHGLSGYLITRSGRRLIFSFMQNNFVRAPAEIKREMHQLLYDIYENY